jgi:hypothetical protein
MQIVPILITKSMRIDPETGLPPNYELREYLLELVREIKYLSKNKKNISSRRQYKITLNRFKYAIQSIIQKSKPNDPIVKKALKDSICKLQN